MAAPVHSPLADSGIIDGRATRTATQEKDHAYTPGRLAMRVLITAHNGYIGSVLRAIVRAAGHDVLYRGSVATVDSSGSEFELREMERSE